MNPIRKVECVCGNRFVTRHPTRKACSKRCAHFKSARKVFRCRLCGVEFIADGCRVGKVRYCGRLCQHRAWDLNRRDDPAEVLRDAEILIPLKSALTSCKECRIDFPASLNKVFCSRKCLSVALSRAMQGQRNYNFRHGQSNSVDYKTHYANLHNEKHRLIPLAILLKRQHQRCALCKKRLKRDQAEIDHVIAVVRGGANKLSNFQALCRTCNRRKHAKPMSQIAREMGFLL
jgi:5-methylcytosine-specific restriction endonuclease McrA